MIVKALSSLEVELSHFGVGSAAVAALLGNSKLRVLQELEGRFRWALIFHLVDSLFDEAQQIVDILRLDKGVLAEVVEEEVRIEDLHQ